MQIEVTTDRKRRTPGGELRKWTIIGAVIGALLAGIGAMMVVGVVMFAGALAGAVVGAVYGVFKALIAIVRPG